jgi:hypothetical protein
VSVGVQINWKQKSVVSVSQRDDLMLFLSEYAAPEESQLARLKALFASLKTVPQVGTVVGGPAAPPTPANVIDESSWKFVHSGRIVESPLQKSAEEHMWHALQTGVVVCPCVGSFKGESADVPAPRRRPRTLYIPAVEESKRIFGLIAVRSARLSER